MLLHDQVRNFLNTSMMHMYIHKCVSVSHVSMLYKSDTLNQLLEIIVIPKKNVMIHNNVHSRKVTSVFLNSDANVRFHMIFYTIFF